ncbi:hypothetical protein OGAPHI_001027 [Ogataea philodendri]|uniref:Uncharacterized protein n=1 Tax=Ogataea philodendri TaxID=1378263 RepID=A0A9P8PFV7_9ASCO|nr:uncharacterized protein OGAPHI_001027 [Ogataea philodendri]KAH3670512.1 hypothetical protein OGAPHI_001027 [Ogataea philodendri]
MHVSKLRDIEGVVQPQTVRLGGLSLFGQVQKFGEHQHQGWRIGDIWVLHSELWWHLASSLVSQNLFSGNPSVVVNQREPALNDLQG